VSPAATVVECEGYSTRADSSRHFACVALGLAAMSALASSTGCSRYKEGRYLHIERQVAISTGHSVSPQVIVRTEDGGYVIAGSDNEQRTEAWATRLDARGKPIWEYVDGGPQRWSDNRGASNRFNAAAMLEDDTTVLCGAKDLTALLVRVGKGGDVLERRTLVPGGWGGPNEVAWLDRCVRWGQGIFLLGQANERGAAPAGWLLNLDNQGHLIWESIQPALTACNDLFISEGRWLFLSQSAPQHRLIKLDSQGKILATKPMPGNVSFIQPLTSTSTIHVFVTDEVTGAKSFWALDQNLRTLARSNAYQLIGIKRAYELPDRSLLLFGSIDQRGGTAAAAKIFAGDGALEVLPLEPLHESGSLEDAVPSGIPGEYATVRIIVRPIPPARVLPGHAWSESVLTWLKFDW
jgi:hypothetical protein